MPHFHIVFYNSNNTFVNTKYNDFDYNDKFYVCMLKYLKKKCPAIRAASSKTISEMCYSKLSTISSPKSVKRYNLPFLASSFRHSTAPTSFNSLKTFDI